MPQRINILPGVSQVKIYGVQGAIRIKADPAALASREHDHGRTRDRDRAGTSYSGAGQFDGNDIESFVLRPNGQIDQRRRLPQSHRRADKDRSPVYLRDIADVVRRRPGRATLAALLRARLQLAGLDRSCWRFRARRAQTRSKLRIRSRPHAAIALELAGIDQPHPDLRSVADIVHSVSRCAGHAADRLRPGGDGDLRFSRSRTDTLIPVVALPLSLLITFCVMWMLELLDQQSDVDGADARNRVPGR